MSNMIEAVQTKYAELSASRPTTLWYDYIPVKNTDGTALDLPIVAFYDAGVSQNITFETVLTETYKFSFAAYGTSYDASRNIYNAICFNGAAPTSRSGFLWNETFALPTNYTFEQCIPVSEPITTRMVSQRTGEAINCYRTTWTIGIQYQRNSGS